MRLVPGSVSTAVLSLALGVGLALGVPASTPPAAAAGPASVTLAGSGWGHGKGMSQYGAKGAALQGKSAGQILGFYYPGTVNATAGGSIAVLITADTSSDVVVKARAGLSVRNVATGASLALSRRGATQWKLDPVSPTRTRLSVRTDKWRVVRDIAGAAEFTVTSGAIRLYYPGGAADYRGRIRSAVPASGTGRDTVNVVSIEQYLRGVVPAEMPARWPAAAVRAQAVAARTYATFDRDTTDRGHFDVYDTTRSQVYRGVGAEEPESDAAIKATAGVIRTYAGAPAFTQFSSSDGGWTAAGSQPYLVAKKDPFEAGSGNPNNSWTVTLTDDVIEASYPGIGDFQKLILTTDPSAGNRVTAVRIQGSTRTTDPMTGDSFRSRFGLKSTLFKIAP